MRRAPIKRVCRRALPFVASVAGVAIALAGTAIAADSGDRTNLASQAELPSGRGLAASFPGDAGLTTNSEVIFADGFESGNLGEGWDETGNKKGKVLQFVAPPAGAGLGQRCLRVEAHLGEDAGGGLTKWFQPADTIFIRFYTRFDPGCDYVHHFVTLRANKALRGGDKWSGFGGAGLQPEGSERFSTAIEPWGNWGRWTAPGRWNFYSYLQRSRPAVGHRLLFINLRPPLGRPLPTDGVRNVIRRAFGRCGIKATGPHILRQSWATAAHQRGTDLKRIADVLGHRSVDTTAPYAKVHFEQLRQAALPWPRLQP
jgi:hypothetical protein